MRLCSLNPLSFLVIIPFDVHSIIDEKARQRSTKLNWKVYLSNLSQIIMIDEITASHWMFTSESTAQTARAWHWSKSNHFECLCRMQIINFAILNTEV